MPDWSDTFQGKDGSWKENRRFAFHAKRQLYKRTCDKCKESMLSVYPTDAPYIVYCHKCFWENIG